ncbi:hypothetical protein ACHAXR_010309 [Thalassiosira sp. AJA248-18]
MATTICIFIASASVAAATTFGPNRAFVAPALFHPGSECTFVATSASKTHLRRSTTRTRIAGTANGSGMDAYDAMSSGNNQQPATATANSGQSSASVTSTPKWSGQNSYTQQFQQQPDTNNNGMDYSNSYTSSYSTNSYEEQTTGNNQHAFAAAVAAVEEESDDPYEMQFTNYLLNLQQEMEMAAAAAGEEAQNSQPMEAAPIMETIMSQQQQPQSSSSMEAVETAAPQPAIVELTEEEKSDQFLKMVSNEVEYKKFLNQSPYSLSDLEVSVLLQRYLDNLEDSFQKNNGKLKGEAKLKGKSIPKEERKTVVVLGTGWASHAFVKLASTYDIRIVVVSPVNHFVFTPMLASAAVGTVEYRSMTEPIRVTNPYIDNFVEGRAIGVNVEAKKVQVQLSSLSTVTGAFKGIAANGPCRLEPEPVLTQIVYDDEGTVQRDKTAGAGGVIELNYDHLICAVGTASRSSMVPGAKENCFNLKTSQDSKRLRTAIGEALEMASRPDVQEFYYPDEATQIEAREERRRRVRIAVVGGGPTGVELSGELCDFFAQVCGPNDAYQHLRDDISVMLIHGGNQLLPSMDVELRERALEALQEQGVDVRLNTRLKEVGLDYIRIGEKGSDVVETIPLGITVWAAGNAPVPFVKDMLSQLPESAAGSGGRIMVDQWCRCPTPSLDSFGSILVLGDVACFESQSKYDSEAQPLPQTAQVAGQQGSFVARMLNRGYDLQHTPPKLPDLPTSEEFSLLRVWLASRGLEEAPGFNFLSLGLLAYVGQEEALNQVMVGNVPLFNYSGKIAFVLWRSVYLAKQASSRNQALIAFDWLRTEAFGRDITRL